MSNLATERLKSSVRKANPCSSRWRRWRTVSPSGPWVVEEPAFLMATATPLSSNSLYETVMRRWTDPREVAKGGARHMGKEMPTQKGVILTRRGGE